MNALRYWFRKRFNRVLALNLLVLTAVLAAWYVTMSYPILASLQAEDELFYGVVHHARQSPMLGRVTFRLHGDDFAEFLLWMDQENRRDFDDWFEPDRPLEVVARRVSERNWVVIALSSTVGMLDYNALEAYRLKLAIAFIAIAGFISFIFLFVATEYWIWFRHRPWFTLWRP